MARTRRSAGRTTVALLSACGILFSIVAAGAAERTEAAAAGSTPSSPSACSGGDGGSSGSNGNDTCGVSLIIKIPDSESVVTTSVAENSLIPDCVRKDPATSENKDGVLTVAANVFTECASKELSRIQETFDSTSSSPPSASPQAAAAPAAAGGSDAPAAVNGSDAASSAAAGGNKRPPVSKWALSASDGRSPPELGLSDGAVSSQDEQAARPAGESYGGSTWPPGHHTNKPEHPFFGLAPGVPSGPGSEDMMSVLQTVFDYRRVTTDFRRLLHGDAHTVVAKYPQHMRELLRTVQELPRHIANSLNIVTAMQANTSDPVFMKVLSDLKDTLMDAARGASELPHALSLVNVLTTLRNIAHRMSTRVRGWNSEQRPVEQRALLSRVEDLLRVPFGDAFRFGGRRHPAAAAAADAPGGGRGSDSDDGQEGVSATSQPHVSHSPHQAHDHDILPRRILESILNPVNIFRRPPFSPNQLHRHNQQ